MNETYKEQKKRYNLKDCCEDCQHHCPQRNKCAMLYPVDHHLRETFDNTKDGERIYFCKMFEAK